MLLFFLFGLFVGATIGLVIGVALAAARSSDEQAERLAYEQKLRRAASVVRNDGHRA